MHIIRKKSGEIIAIASRLEDAISIADGAKVDKEDYVVQESTDQKNSQKFIVLTMERDHYETQQKI